MTSSPFSPRLQTLGRALERLGFSKYRYFARPPYRVVTVVAYEDGSGESEEAIGITVEHALEQLVERIQEERLD